MLNIWLDLDLDLLFFLSKGDDVCNTEYNLGRSKSFADSFRIFTVSMQGTTSPFSLISFSTMPKVINQIIFPGQVT